MKNSFISTGKMAWIIFSIVIGCTQVGHATGVSTPEKKNISVEKKVAMMNLSWSDIHQMAQTVAHNLPKREWKGILAITRGGLVPAGLLSHMLGIRRIEVLNAVSYQGKKSGTIQFLNEPDVKEGGEGWLIIDELSETGGTLRAIRKKYPKAYIATLLIKPKGKHAVDLFARVYEQDVWLNFPWELVDKE